MSISLTHLAVTTSSPATEATANSFGHCLRYLPVFPHEYGTAHQVGILQNVDRSASIACRLVFHQAVARRPRLVECRGKWAENEARTRKNG